MKKLIFFELTILATNAISYFLGLQTTGERGSIFAVLLYAIFGFFLVNIIVAYSIFFMFLRGDLPGFEDDEFNKAREERKAFSKEIAESIKCGARSSNGSFRL